MSLNNRITVEQRTTGEDAIGQPVETWETVAELWADVRFLSGMSAIRGDADVSEVQASVRIRHRTGLNQGMRVIFDGQAYDIKAVLPDGKRQFIDLICGGIQ